MSKKAPPQRKKTNQQQRQRKRRNQRQRRKQRQNRRKLRKQNMKRSTEKKREFMQCTKLKITKLVGHAQPASDVEQDTSWQTTMTGTLAVTAVLLVTNRNKQF